MNTVYTITGLLYELDYLLSWQLKEEEANKLKDSLDQQKEEAKSREEELHAEALEQVPLIRYLIYAIIFNTITRDTPLVPFR